MPSLSKGEIAEKLVSNFFDNNFSKIFSFPNPKTKTNAEITDILVWLNRTVFLIEVKTRDEGSASIESWFRSRVQKAIGQITKSFNRIKSKEQIFLHNSYYHTPLDLDGITQVIGLIILVYEENCIVKPTDYFSEIYKHEIPIHILAWKDLEQMIEEIDTVPDFIYYLHDRFKYLQISDILLEQELNVLGHYKSQSNKFPEIPVDFSSYPYWENYKTLMESQIQARSAHNAHSIWLDKLEQLFTDQRKLFDSYPLGLYFAWELGALSRRERALLGEKLDSVQEWFEEGHSSRQFSWQNGKTGNWLVVHFSKLSPTGARKRLKRLVELKLIKEIHLKSFQFGVYGFSFGVSIISPPQLQGLNSAIVIGVEAVRNQYSTDDIEEALKEWGDESTYYTQKIDEFPR